MSRKVATLVYSKQAGSMARKAVLAYFADRANDDGSGVWTAKQRIADEIECSKQTVITVVKSLLADGLISEVGRRPNGNGYTVEYAITLAAVEALPDSKRAEEGVQFWTGQGLDGSNSQTPRGQAALPKPSLNRPKPKKDKPSLVAHEIPEGWEPRQFGGDTKSRKVVDGWPPGELEYQLEHFRAHHRKKGSKFKDWQDAWSTWVLNWRSFGNGRTNGMGRHQPGDGLGRTARAGLAVFGADPSHPH